MTFQAPDGLAEVLRMPPATGLRLSRFFRCPTGLAADSTVELVVEPVSLPGNVRLNAVTLGPLERRTSRFVITDRLQDGNELQLDLDLSADPIAMAQPGRIDVRLEIR